MSPVGKGGAFSAIVTTERETDRLHRSRARSPMRASRVVDMGSQRAPSRTFQRRQAHALAVREEVRRRGTPSSARTGEVAMAESPALRHRSRPFTRSELDVEKCARCTRRGL
jgi:hypothetical protein